MATTGPESKMVCTGEAYLALAAAAGSPMPGAVCDRTAAGRAGACLTSGAGCGCRCLWLETRIPLRNAKGRVSLNTGGVSGGLRSVRPWLAVFLPAGRCVELGSAVYPLALSLAVRSLAGCTADRAADDRSVSGCLCGL